MRTLMSLRDRKIDFKEKDEYEFVSLFLSIGITMKKTVFLFCLFFAPLTSIEWNILTGPRTVSLGPEVYSMHRNRANGSKQHGWLWGVHAIFERERENALYWGVEGRWAEGDLDGHLANAMKLHSRLSEGDIEGRVGFFGSFTYGYPIAIIPFVGGGYYWGTNDFHHPSPMRVKFHDRYSFWSVGFLTKITLTPCLQTGLRFFARRMGHGYTHVSDDPEFSSVNIEMNNKWHFLIDIPIIYSFTLCEKTFGININPFFEYRRLGGRENFPFDFIDTQFQNWGVRLLLTHSF